MKLRDELHRAIDALDNQSLAVVYEQVASLLKPAAPAAPAEPPPSLDEVLALTRASKRSWADDVAEARDERF